MMRSILKKLQKLTIQKYLWKKPKQNGKFKIPNSPLITQTPLLKKEKHSGLI